ncbi:hypothetical protein [Flavobacterium sp. CS20]|uniref:hypothetical protein n=1 Tax=Flavobacterium sp. CS20 TaxID=2775246 RepID=UPI001B3A41ED|nr:hypothetical protein [Flavobacterium sp. CS20]QTY27947.1 hypothetical protein IGB25_05460 [Flavobacterium sp. CS20]
MKNLYLLLVFLSLMGCNSTKKVEKALLSGNYQTAINLAVDQIQKGKDNKKTEDQKLILQQAFKNYQKEIIKKNDFLKKDPTTNAEKEIYENYLELYETQNNIKPLLPLYHQGKKLKFKFEDISSDLIIAKQNYAEYLYQSGQSFMDKEKTLSYRNAYEIFEKLDQLIPQYKNSNNLAEKASYLGKDFVFVNAVNNTEVSIPKKLEAEILDFNTYGIDNQWTEYHSNQKDGNPYQFQINLIFENITFSPEQIVEKEKHINKTIEISEVQTDRSGNEITKNVKVNVSGLLNTISQSKSVSIIAQVDYINLDTAQKIDDFKLGSQYVFENIYATFDGDERALDKKQKSLLNNKAVPFPSNEQMLFDATEDVKLKLKSILKRHPLR